MRRWLAALLLLVFATFLASAGADHCHDEGRGMAAPHVFCLDDCAPAVIPAAPMAPPPDPLPRPTYVAEALRPAPEPDLEPEKAPPRA